MSVAYSASYIDSVLERRDAMALYTIISVRGQNHELPDECKLFIHLLHWLGSDWQYYESLREKDYVEFCELLEKFGMQDVLAKYREGKSLPLESVNFMKWFGENEPAILERVFPIVARASEFLKRNDG